tara:strand:- start:1424 stop:1630 length:207 start_codon:yes stop_codon:yes gene_type:complete
MVVQEGDLIITLPKVAKIQAVVNLHGGEMGVVVETHERLDSLNVFAVVINNHIYYLFEDEFEKLEEKC